MPKREDIKIPPVKPAKATKAEKQSKLSTNGKPSTIPAADVADVPEVDIPSTGGKQVKKSPLQEKFKKFLKECNPEYPDMINDLSERMVSDDDTKFPVVFAVFSKNGESDEDVDNEFNKDIIKNVLFFYHTAEEKHATGKVELIEVLPPEDENSPHILCYHEE